MKSFKIVDRACSTDVLVERVHAYHSRCWQGDILQLIGPRGTPPRQRRLPVVDALHHPGVRRALALLRYARQLMKLEVPWSIDNRELGDVILPGGCHATGCAECGHCERVAARVVRPRATQQSAQLAGNKRFRKLLSEFGSMQTSGRLAELSRTISTRRPTRSQVIWGLSDPQ